MCLVVAGLLFTDDFLNLAWGERAGQPCLCLTSRRFQKPGQNHHCPPDVLGHTPFSQDASNDNVLASVAVGASQH
ncbi:hypothetical protein COCON_G00187950 [Conger conger]|uniref:Secreted protein n=1 Tax=Conger conger TaxID=82655 RepID=A0A9Q1D3R2_CONCO|nr:hypothetical protein COCON_G00187950 [Conger conger]